MALLLLLGGVTTLLAEVGEKLWQSGRWFGANRWADPDIEDEP